jgi:hypothetical protein
MVGAKVVFSGEARARRYTPLVHNQWGRWKRRGTTFRIVIVKSVIVVQCGTTEVAPK